MNMLVNQCELYACMVQLDKTVSPHAQSKAILNVYLPPAEIHTPIMEQRMTIAECQE